MGLNTPYTFCGSPVRLLYGDADADGINELAEIFVDHTKNSWRPVRKLEVFANTFPQVRNATLATGRSLPQPCRESSARLSPT